MSAVAAGVEVGPNIVAVVVLIMPVVTVGLNAWIAHKAKQIHAEVKTINGQRLGELADSAETRRISEVQPIDRTPAEVEHLAVVPVDIRDRTIGG